MAELKNLQKLQRLFNLMDDDALTKEQFRSAFQKVIELLKQQDQERNSKVEALANLIDTTRKELEASNSGDRGTIKEELDKLSVQYTKDVNAMQKLFSLAENRLRDQIPDEYDDEDVYEALNNLESRLDELKIPEAFDATELQKDIKSLKDAVEELKKRPIGKVQGGVTNARIEQAFKYILKTETPTGDIDGANTTYTVSQPIFAVLAFSLNGEVIPQLPNYTINGNTIEFSTALPAAYSGKDFEIKYL